MTSVLPELRSGFTIDDLADFPSDGNRYELIDERRWNGDDEQVRVIEGDDEATLDWPFEVTVTPSRLLLPNG